MGCSKSSHLAPEISAVTASAKIGPTGSGRKSCEWKGGRAKGRQQSWSSRGYEELYQILKGAPNALNRTNGHRTHWCFVVVPTTGSGDHDDDDVDGQQRCSVYIDDDDSADEVFYTSAGTIHVQFYARGDEDCVPAMVMANAPKKKGRKI